MFNQAVKRMGFACKIQDKSEKPVESLNIKSTTISWLNSQTRQKAEDRLWNLMQHNLKVLFEQIQWVGRQDKTWRQFRISSDLLPAYSHDNWMWFYFKPDVVSYLEKTLKNCGDLARQLDVRLSFHPGQFCVLASESEEIVENSLKEFEYHADVIRYMGYGKTFQDFKCNVHIGGKRGPEGIKRALQLLSPEARNCITIENAEFTWHLQHSLELKEHCALVLDIHHHWIATGEYIQPNDPRILQVQESWRGVRPVIHYSCSREDVLVNHSREVKPNLHELLKTGFTRSKLRAHSEYYWNEECNWWALEHLGWADIMLESKQKNLAWEKLQNFRLELEV